MKQKAVHAIVKYFYPVAAGIETNMLETYRHMVAAGWSVTVHTSTNTLTENAVLRVSETVKGIPVKRYAWSLVGFWPQIDWDHTDVVALHNFNIVPHTPILLYALFRKFMGKKKVIVMLTPHGGFTPDWHIFSPVVALAKRLYHYTVGTCLINTAVDVVRAVSSWEAKEMNGHGVQKERIATIPNGMEDEAYVDVDKKASAEIKDKAKSYGAYMIQIGRIYGIKNYETVVKALTELPKNLNFVIVGPVGSIAYFESLKALILKRGLRDRVFFAGVVRGVDKYYLIKHARLMVHMARWESFCNAVHEGMSQGLACVVANNTALPLLIKNGINGFCVDTLDVATLVEKIRFILERKNAKAVQAMRVANMQYGLSNSWKEVARKVMSVLDEKHSVQLNALGLMKRYI